jgi:heme A synthase
MKNLLVVMAWLEAITGIGLIGSPAALVPLLLGAALDSPVGLVLARVAGAALLALGLACWLARGDGGSRAARGLVAGMLLYNGAVGALLVYAGLSLDLSAIGLWPTVLVHLTLAVWCVVCLRQVSPLTGQPRNHNDRDHHQMP